MAWKRTRAENRQSRARFGRAYTLVVFFDVPVDAVRLMRGAAISRCDRSQDWANPFVDRTRPLRVMLDPNLNHNDPDVESVLKLGTRREVVEFLSTSLDPHSMPRQVRRVELERVESRDRTENWVANLEDTWVPMFNEIRGIADYAFGPLDADSAHLAVLTGQTAAALGCDLFLSTNQHLLEGRASISGWGSQLGPVDPRELARLAAVLFRQDGLIPMSENSTLKGGVYDATVHDWVPSYLVLYRELCKHDGCDRTLDYMDGLLGNCALSVMALDRLARLHFAEDTKPANNTTVRHQQYESASFVIALSAALESLTWVLFILAKAEAGRLQVTFRRLLPSSRKMSRWVSRVSEYSPKAVSAFRHGFGPSLELVVHFRDFLQHHVPIPSAVGAFGKVACISSDARFIDKWRVGVLLAEPHAGESHRWPRSDEAMGVLPGAVMPYPFFRSSLHDLLDLVECVLRELCTTLGVKEVEMENPHFSPGWGRSDPELTRLLTRSL